jgi:hypothetical protein
MSDDPYIDCIQCENHVSPVRGIHCTGMILWEEHDTEGFVGEHMCRQIVCVYPDIMRDLKKKEGRK